MEALLHTVEETAEILTVSRRKVFELIRTNELRSVKIGGLRRVPSRAIEEYIERLMEGAPQKRTDGVGPTARDRSTNAPRIRDGSAAHTSTPRRASDVARSSTETPSRKLGTSSTGSKGNSTNGVLVPITTSSWPTTSTTGSRTSSRRSGPPHVGATKLSSDCT